MSVNVKGGDQRPLPEIDFKFTTQIEKFIKTTAVDGLDASRGKNLMRWSHTRRRAQFRFRNGWCHL